MEGKKVVYSNEYILQNGDRFDYLKFILAIFIVAVHTVPMGLYLRPILRIAVPIFFIMSSYFFFIKQKKSNSFEDCRHAMKGFAKRLLKLYFFWFVALLPLTVYTNGWYSVSLDTLLNIILGFLFGNTFKASWYIMALLLNIIFVWYATTKKVSNVLLFILGVLEYIGCCMVSSYYSLAASLPGFDAFYNGYVRIFSEPYNSFPCALLFICIGKAMAENSIFLSKNVLLPLVAVFFALYFCEFYVTRHFGLAVADDCFFTLPVVSTLCFMLVGQSVDWQGPKWLTARDARSCSTIIYCSHISLASVLVIVGFHLGYGGYICENYLVLFLMTLLASLLLSFLIIRLEKTTHFKLLKYSH